MKRIYSEVRCDYYNSVHNFWTVDAWMGPDENDEEGKVVAVINGTTGDVWYCDPDARIDSAVDELIKAKVKEIRNPLGTNGNHPVSKYFLRKNGFRMSSFHKALTRRLKGPDFSAKVVFHFSVGGDKTNHVYVEYNDTKKHQNRSHYLDAEAITTSELVNFCSKAGIDLLRD